MSGGFFRVTHASRVLASASSRGNGDFDSPAHRRQASPEANGPAEYLGAFFAGFVRCIVKFSSDQQ
jgi:hypothetical protein